MAKRTLFVAGLLLIVLAVAGLAFLNRGAIALSVLKRGAAEAMAKPSLKSLSSGLHVAFCGTGSPMPDRQRAGPCTAIIAGGRLFVFDSGDGSAETLSLMGLSPGKIEAVFLTHLHSDHIDGLGSLALQHWGSVSAKAPLPLYGPSGVEKVAAGLKEIYDIDSGYRLAHHGPNVMPMSGFGYAAQPFVAPARGSEAQVYEKDGVRIIAFGVDHGPVEPALGYRIEYQGLKVVISGDTKACDCVTSASKGAALLVHEAIAPEIADIMSEAAKASGQAGVAQVFKDIQNYHTTPSEVAKIGREAKVGGVALTHIVPALQIKALEIPFMGKAAAEFAADTKRPFWLMHDGDLISIAQNGDLEKRNILRY